MTVGSWDRSIPDNGVTKLTHTKSWNGADSPRIVYPKPTLHTVVRYSKKQRKVITITFRKRSIGVTKPPKRARTKDNNYSMSYTKLRDYKSRVFTSFGEVYGPYYVMDSYCVPNWTPWNSPDEAFDSNDQIKLIGKLREKMSGSDFNLGIVLGEGHQTLRMIGDTAITIAKSLHHLKKGDLAGAARSLLGPANRKPIKPYKAMRPFRPTADNMSSRWLELQYGWLPLLSDVEAGAQFIAHKLSVPVSQTYRMSILKSRAGERISYNPFGSVTAKSLAVARRSLKIVVSEPPSTLASLGLLNPEVVAWELVPWSFVIDWFIPISSYLEARATLSNVTIASYTQSTTVKSYNFAPTGKTILDPVPDDTGYARILMSRVTGTGAPKLPLPQVKTLRQVATLKHALNGIALLAQVAVGRSKKNERAEQLAVDAFRPSS